MTRPASASFVFCEPHLRMLRILTPTVPTYVLPNYYCIHLHFVDSLYLQYRSERGCVHYCTWARSRDDKNSAKPYRLVDSS